MNTLSYFVSPILGFIIGYLTNWLAIKMMFRPHEKKKIGSVSVPFTPGLIPKERYNLSKAIGETIGQHVLHEDALTEMLSSQDVQNSIDKAVEQMFLSLKEKELTLEELISNAFFSEDFKEYIWDKAQSALISFLNEEKTAAFLDQLLQKPLTEKTLHSVLNMVETLAAEQYEKSLQEQGIETLRKSIQNWMQTPLEALYKDNPEQWADKLANQIIPMIMEKALLLTYDKEFEMKALSLIEKMIEANVGSLGKLFVRPEKLYQNAVDTLKTWVAEPDPVHKEKILLKLLHHGNTPLINFLPESWQEDFAGNISQKVYQYLSEKDIKAYSQQWRLKGLAYGKDKSLDTLIAKLVPNYKHKIHLFLEHHTTNIIANQLHPKYDQYYDALMKKPVALWLDNLFPDKKQLIKDHIKQYAKKAVVKAAPYMASSIDISSFIRERIDAFDMMEAENIVVSVVQKELKAITILGGVLGFIIGLIPVCMNLFS